MNVKQYQHLLAYLGYYTGAVDGLSGPQTQAAVTAFQTDFGGLTVDGVAGELTQKALRHAVAYGIEKSTTEDSTETEETTGIFWDEIKYWTREEFRCQCGGQYCSGFPAEPEEKLVRLADDVRAHFGKPGHRSSGLRCERWNAIQGGVSNSRHMTGKALDFRIEGHTAAQVMEYVDTLPGVRYAYAIDDAHIHMDIL